jgi:hypothetical protein
MVSTATSYDFDVSRRNRRELPDSCGVVPDSGRGGAFAVMLVLGILQIVAKGFSVALLAITNTTWLVYYLVIDMAILFAYKIARGDFLTWHPLPYAVSVFFSIFMRITTKTITDFSGSMGGKDSDVLGGLYYSFSVVLTQSSVFVAVHVYNEYAKDVIEESDDYSDESSESGGTKLSHKTTWSVAVVLFCLWAVLYAYFVFGICVPRFRSTFWNSNTGRETTLKYFAEGGGDSFRITIFDRNRAHWLEIEEDVRAWTLANWGAWVAEKPGWFTDEVIGTVPDDFIPPQYLSQLGANRERRGSAAGSVRLSVRRMSAQPPELPA